MKDSTGLPKPLVNWWSDHSEGDTEFLICADGRDEPLAEPIAIVPAREDDDGKPMMLEAEAVADLIAAAPALLEALELAVATIERLATQHGAFNSSQGTLDVARSAIARARGHNETP